MTVSLCVRIRRWTTPLLLLRRGGHLVGGLDHRYDLRLHPPDAAVDEDITVLAYGQARTGVQQVVHFLPQDVAIRIEHRVDERLRAALVEDVKVAESIQLRFGLAEGDHRTDRRHLERDRAG